MNILVFRIVPNRFVERVPKAVAAAMVASGAFFHLSKTQICERFVRQAPKLAPDHPRLFHSFSELSTYYDHAEDDTRLPPIEIAGCHFQLPKSPQWRREHRRTVLGIELIQ